MGEKIVAKPASIQHPDPGDLNSLDQVRFLKELPIPVLREVAPGFQRRAYLDGQSVLQAGQPDSPVLFVLHGSVRAYHLNHEGCEQMLTYLFRFNILPCEILQGVIVAR